VIKSYLSSNYREDPIRQLSFRTSPDTSFFYGADHYPRAGNDARNMKNMKRVLFMSEENYDFSHIEASFDKVLVIHKGVDEWRNKEIGKDLYEYVFFPIPENIALQEVGFDCRDIEVTYAGHVGVHQKWLSESIIDPISRRKYALISATKSQHTTHYNVSYKEKISILSRSKVSIVHNLHMIDIGKANRTLVESMKKDEKSFMRCNSWYDAGARTWRSSRPELKTRIFEASAAGCIPLVLKDEFHSVDDFFVPNQDFMYFETGNLSNVLEEILTNYSLYKQIAQSAKEKCKLYTDVQFSKKYLGAE